MLKGAKGTKEMKILFVGDLNGYSRSLQRKKALDELGHQVTSVTSVPIGDVPGLNDKFSYIAKFACKMGYPLDRSAANKKIIEQVDRQNFDLVWIEKGLVIRPKILTYIKFKSKNTKLVSYSEDDMYQRWNQSQYYIKGLKYYDIVFTTKSYNCRRDELPSLGAKKVVFIDKAYDSNLHRPVNVTTEDKIKFGADVGFVGTFEDFRANKLMYLAENGVKIRIWGNGWKKWKEKHCNLLVENRPVYSEDYVKAICSTKINLCFLRKMNRDLQTDRSIEIPACGAFMLAEDTEEHRRLFVNNQEAVFFDQNDSKDLLDKVKYFTGKNELIIKIGKAGRKRCINNGYSHHGRLDKMLKFL